MSAIGEALVATAVGIGVAIPAVAAFNYFSRTSKRAPRATLSARRPQSIDRSARSRSAAIGTAVRSSPPAQRRTPRPW